MWTVLLDELSDYVYDGKMYRKRNEVGLGIAEKHIKKVLNGLWRNLEISTYDRLEPTSEFPIQYICCKPGFYCQIKWSQSSTNVTMNDLSAAAMLGDLTSILHNGDDKVTCVYALLCIYRLLRIYKFEEQTIDTCRRLLSSDTERLMQIKEWYAGPWSIKSRTYYGVDYPMPEWKEIEDYLNDFIKEKNNG